MKREFLLFAIRNKNGEYAVYMDHDWKEYFFPWIAFPTYKTTAEAEEAVFHTIYARKADMIKNLADEGFITEENFKYIGSLQIEKPHHNKDDVLRKYRFHVIMVDAASECHCEFKSLKELSSITISNKALIGFLEQYESMIRSA